MSKYKILWVILLFFIISICGVLYFQKNISNEMSRFEIAYINNHLIIPDSQEIIEKGYPKNESGQTYGPDLSDYVGSVPDLILAESEEGIKGYLKKTDKDSITSSSRTLPLYLQDGQTKIAELTLKTK